MFEYLMPVARDARLPADVLDQTYRAAVRRQIAYAAGAACRGGSARVAYNLRDRHQTYQYRAFGVPDLALKRGLARDLVIAPYATALARDDRSAAARSRTSPRSSGSARFGPFGFHDALDYTRPDPGTRYAVVQHLHGAPRRHEPRRARQRARREDVWQRRFHADPLVRAVELLLHERIPRRLVFQPTQREPTPRCRCRRRSSSARPCASTTPRTRRSRASRCSATCRTRSWWTTAARGYSRYESLAVTRWRADSTTRRHGPVLLREGPDERTDVVARRTSPCARPPTPTASNFATDRVTFHRLRRRDRDAHGDHRRPRGRGRGPAHHGDESDAHDARRRGDELRRGRAHAARRGSRASGVRATCSSRRSGTTGVTPCSPRGARARPPSRACGARTSPRWTARSSGR